MSHLYAVGKRKTLMKVRKIEQIIDEIVLILNMVLNHLVEICHPGYSLIIHS